MVNNTNDGKQSLINTNDGKQSLINTNRECCFQ